MTQLIFILVLVAVYMFFKNKTTLFKAKDLKYLVFIEIALFLLLFHTHLLFLGLVIGGVYLIFKKLA